MECGQSLDEVPKPLMKMVATDVRQAQKVFPLPDPNDHADAGGEPNDHGIGNELDKCAKLGDAGSNYIAPAIIVAICKPSMPYLAVTLAKMTMNASVGPAICSRLPPKSETNKPPTIAV